MNNSGKTKLSIDSPKTPGGISKSLLTPCRRVGLSRKWGKKGPSPFVSPLSSGSNTNAEVKIEKESKKRKICDSDDEETCNNEHDLQSTPTLNDTNDMPSNINSTPTRTIAISKKKSKTLLMKDTKEQNINSNVHHKKSLKVCNDTEIIDRDSRETPKSISKLSRNNSKKIKCEASCDNTDNNKESSDTIKVLTENSSSSKEKSPNNLTKECIVVIQNKMMKNLDNSVKGDTTETLNSSSQTLFDSDSDEVPLCTLSKKENVNTNVKIEDEFKEKKVKKLKDKNTSITGLTVEKQRAKKLKPTNDIKPSINTEFDDDDDFESINKRTILIKKSYDKVIKPSKAKSTGSITQKDIDELKARIEMKKKVLLARSVTEDTEELRSLIKKWQKGCQDALCELFELMRKKFPDRQNMDYSEILQTLKIPPDLVGYDVDNDCFITPEDSNIILSSINT